METETWCKTHCHCGMQNEYVNVQNREIFSIYQVLFFVIIGYHDGKLCVAKGKWIIEMCSGSGHSDSDIIAIRMHPQHPGHTRGSSMIRAAVRQFGDSCEHLHLPMKRTQGGRLQGELLLTNQRATVTNTSNRLVV